ncbi:MAG: beta-N-acetylhexosaminidase [Acidobacteria bacterium]|nr:beta-N-acetylhexosaminidase [Acidobacteriota bacterium]
MSTSIRHAVGQLLFGSLAGVSVQGELQALGREFGLGGITLFSRNIEAPEQVAELAWDLRILSRDLPPWIAIDQEGGRVARLRAPFTEWPPMAVLGRSGDDALARRFAGAMAAELRAVGVTLDFAPVLDIHTNPANPVIGDRALSTDAAMVARLGVAVIEGLQSAGVAACGKHFPGHGDTSVDSHLELPLVEHPPDRIRQVECVPFEAAIRAGVAFLMTAHVLVPSIDEARPATLSPRIMTDLLRHDLEYDGAVLSDDLEMKAIAAQYAPGEAAVLAVAAGCDGVLVCSGSVDVQAEVLEALVHGVEDGRIPRARLDDALRRLRRQKERFLTRPEPPRLEALRAILGCDVHRQVADEMGRFL